MDNDNCRCNINSKLKEKQMKQNIFETIFDNNLNPTTAITEIDDYEQEVDGYKDKFIYKMAEFDNYKKRKENEISNLLKYASEDLIKDLLLIIDDLEKLMLHLKDKGTEIIFSKFLKILSLYGLEKIDSLNKPFDINYHEALLERYNLDVPPSYVVEEIQKGYLLKDKVIRYSKVIVSCNSKEETNDPEGLL